MTSYNEWLRDYLMQGGTPTHVYDDPVAGDFVCIESNPHLVSLPLEEMYGAKSESFVLSRKYDVEKYRNRFYGGGNELYGWDSKGRAKVYGRSVPVYEDTVDRLIALDEEAPIEVRYAILKLRQKAAESAAEWASEREAENMRSEMIERHISEMLSDPELYIKDSSCTTSYNAWLKDYLMQGGTPTHVYDDPVAGDFVCIESNPHLVSLPLEEMYGARLKSFVLSRKYDVEKYRNRFYGGGNKLYGWDSNGRAKVYGRSVPVYEDTVDNLIALDEEAPIEVRNTILKLRQKAAKSAVEWAFEREARKKQSEMSRRHISEVLSNPDLYKEQ